MAVHNKQIAEIFYNLADLLEIEGENPFRVRAYRNAARVINGLSQNVSDLIIEGKDLTELPGIGDAIAIKIETIVKTGKLPALEDIEKRIPHVLAEMMRIPGLGPKKIKALHEKLHINSMEKLLHAIEKGKVRQLPGFSEKTELMIKSGVKRLSTTSKRLPRVDAKHIAEPIIAYLQKAPGIKKVIIAGSYRRRKETVGDLDILVTANQGEKVINYFVNFDDVKKVLSKGRTRSTVILLSNLQVDLRVVPQQSYGAALHYFTGSKAHNIAIRKMGVNKKLKINEYGVFKGKKRIAGKTESEVYRQVGLPYIEPELREDHGEIEAAKKKRLPKLIQLKDIRGDLHCHSKATDGRDTIEAMSRAAAELGYQYIALTDHSKHLTVAHGLNKKRLLQQIKQIDRLNEKLKNIVILKSIELDILENGSLDLPNDILKQLDLTVCSVHYKFNLSRKKQTERIIRAMDNPHFNILAHPTGQLLQKRDPYEIDVEKVMLAAKERGCFLELNAQPERMDLNAVYCKMAKEIGLKIAISTDSHSTDNLKLMTFGIDQARRGWLEKKDVINTRTLLQLRKLLKR